MILTGHDVKWYVERGRLRFTPNLAADQYQQNGVDLRLAPSVGRLDEDEFGLVVSRATAVAGVSRFSTGKCYLAHTEEVIQMPDDLMAFVELRSTWARCGLILPPTVVDSGFEGDLTLEVFCAGPGLEIPVGKRFAHLIFAKLTNPAEPYRGKYQHQRGVTPAIFDGGRGGG